MTITSAASRNTCDEIAAGHARVPVVRTGRPSAKPEGAQGCCGCGNGRVDPSGWPAIGKSPSQLAWESTPWPSRMRSSARSWQRPLGGGRPARSWQRPLGAGVSPARGSALWGAGVSPAGGSALWGAGVSPTRGSASWGAGVSPAGGSAGAPPNFPPGQPPAPSATPLRNRPRANTR